MTSTTAEPTSVKKTEQPKILFKISMFIGNLWFYTEIEDWFTDQFYLIEGEDKWQILNCIGSEMGTRAETGKEFITYLFQFKIGDVVQSLLFTRPDVNDTYISWQFYSGAKLMYKGDGHIGQEEESVYYVV